MHCQPSPAPVGPLPHGSHLRFLVDNVQQVHYYREVIDGHGRVHRGLHRQELGQGWDLCAHVWVWSVG